MHHPGGVGRSKSAVMGKDANAALIRQHARQLNNIATTTGDEDRGLSAALWSSFPVVRPAKTGLSPGSNSGRET